MVDRIDELNRIALAVKALKDNREGADYSAVIDYCASAVIEGRMPDHHRSIGFSITIGLLVKKGKKLYLTDSGTSFLELNPQGLYELTEDQRMVLLRSTFMDGVFRYETKTLLKSFSTSYESNTFRWSEVDSTPLEGDTRILDLLRQLGLLTRGPGWIEVSPDYVDTVAEFIKEGPDWSENAFQEHLREKIEVGELAESLVLAFEIERLKHSLYLVESRCVRRISKLRVNAGFDIESFDGKSRDITFNRFIEVKGARSSTLTFFWSKNEMEVAGRLGNRYWIYFQGGISLETGTSRYKPILFRDPINSILRNSALTISPHGMFVTGKLRGEIA